MLSNTYVHNQSVLLLVINSVGSYYTFFPLYSNNVGLVRLGFEIILYFFSVNTFLGIYTRYSVLLSIFVDRTLNIADYGEFVSFLLNYLNIENLM